MHTRDRPTFQRQDAQLSLRMPIVLFL